MRTVQTLCNELTSIQHALAEDSFEHLQYMLETYHTHLGEWFKEGTGGNIEQIFQLRNAHRETLTLLQQRQRSLDMRMQAGRNSGRAVRAYLVEGRA